MGLLWPQWVSAGGPPTLKQLLKTNNPILQTRWAIRFEHGEGVKQSYARAITLYCSAARRGYGPAQYHLGWLYANGRGVDQNEELAAAWFHQAAQKGDGHARRMLALLGQPKSKKIPSCGLPGDTRLRQAGVSPAQRRQITTWVEQLAPAYGLDPQLVLAVVRVESGFNVRARSPKNAQGLMQLIPATAQRFGVTDIMDPVQNLRGGMAYLRWLLIYFEGDLKLALAAYNAGENAVDKYQGIPPYAETRAYVAAVIRHYGSDQHPPVV
jgi:TPR repeat protein